MDVAAKQKTTPRERIAQLVRLFGTPEPEERANAWRALKRAMDSARVTWSDVGNWIEEGTKPDPGMQKALKRELRSARRARATAVASMVTLCVRNHRIWLSSVINGSVD